MYKRMIQLPPVPDQSFFLWGPRQTGKTTLLKALYPQAFRVDLLKNDVVVKYLKAPSAFREEVAALPKERLVVVDEIQRVPALLDEVHYLIQEQGRIFVLCGSSARKLKRGHANLLGGRAMVHELKGLSALEIGVGFDLAAALNGGLLPPIYGRKNTLMALKGYVDNYLRQEIIHEGLTRNLPVFADFLRVAAIGDTEIVNLTNIARECGMAVSTVRGHYEILADTLLGAFLPAFTLRPKRRVLHAPKFYFSDVGVVNHLARRGLVEEGSELFGKAFENFIRHEISLYLAYNNKDIALSYWRLSTGVEVDFILGDGEVAVDVKGKREVGRHDVKGLLQFKRDHPQVKKLVVVTLGDLARKTEEGVFVLPYQEFLDELWKGGKII